MKFLPFGKNTDIVLHLSTQQNNKTKRQMVLLGLNHGSAQTPFAEPERNPSFQHRASLRLWSSPEF